MTRKMHLIGCWVKRWMSGIGCWVGGWMSGISCEVVAEERSVVRRVMEK